MPDRSQMELASSSMNLTKALLDFIPVPNALVQFGLETYNWLIRERIDESSFQSCRELARGLAYPNDEGSQIQQDIEEADKQLLDMIKSAPVRLIVSGSLGRLIGKDIHTAYMVSTVATLTKFHDVEFAADSICSMMLDQGGHEREVNLAYNVKRSPIKAVISKVVESIYVNVVNAGHGLGDIPEGLRHLHPHLLDYPTFAGIVMGIQKTDGNVTIRSDRFLADLTLWLLFHFDGKIQVCVETRILYEAFLGSGKRSLRLLIKDLCPEDRRRCLKEDAPVEAMISIGDNVFTFLRGNDDTEYRPCSYQRRPFYEVDELTNSPRSSRSQFLNHAERNSIADVAKRIMSWMLTVRIAPAHELHDLTFRADLESASTGLKLGELMPKHPGLLNLNTGISSRPQVIPRQPDVEATDVSSEEWNFQDVQRMHPAKVMDWFLVACDLMEEIRPGCSCAACKNNTPLRECKPGCLREAGYTRLLLLIADGICDAFGGRDASGRPNPEDIRSMIALVLGELLEERIIRWNSWFELVACTLAGFSCNVFEESTGADDGGSSWAACQYGSTVAAAPWLDLNQKASVKGCFGLAMFEGNIQGVRDELGLVKCEQAPFTRSTIPLSETMGPAPPPHVEELEMEIDPSGPASDPIQLIQQVDTSKIEILTAIFRSTSDTYRLLTTVHSGNNIRVVDPSLVPMGLANSKSGACTHDAHSRITRRAQVIVNDFERLIGLSPSNGDERNKVETSQFLDSHAKVNMTLSMTMESSMGFEGAVMRRHDKCCMNCAIDLSQNEEGFFRNKLIINKAIPNRRQIGGALRFRTTES